LADDECMSVRTFQSWKEIALYMGRGVRTVQRWEAFGLPVHRPAGRERSAVFAIEHELDDWMQQTQTQLCRPLHTNGEADGALVTRIQELENEVRELREQIASLNGSHHFVPVARAA
jgi:phage terminase Nu1 subunit (DNA packaging protein)